MGACSFGIAVACAGNLATTLAGTPGLGANPENVIGAAITFSEGYSVVLVIVYAHSCNSALVITCARPCCCHHKKGRSRYAIDITILFLDTHGFAAVLT